MLQPVIRVGEWLVTPSVNQISKKGCQLTLEPRLIDFLVFFTRHSEEVLSQDKLIGSVWTRDVVISHVVTQSISELRKSLKDSDGVSLKYIATVLERGYKLTVPMIWCTKEGEEFAPQVEALTPSSSAAIPMPPTASRLPEAPDSSADLIAPMTVPAAAPTVASTPSARKRPTTALMWRLFLLALGTCVTLVTLSSMESRSPVDKAHLLPDPRDTDIHPVSGDSCANWSSQHSYAVGLAGLVTTSLNTFSTFMVHDKTDYNVSEPGSPGKTLTIEFVNQRHYWAQQCSVSIQLVDSADSSTILDKRYFVTNDNQLTIQNGLMSSLPDALTQPWPARMRATLKQYQSSQSAALTYFYQSH